MKTCEHRKFLGPKARGLTSSNVSHHALQGADFFTRFYNKVENSLINKKISNSVHIAVLICTVTMGGNAKPQTVRGIC